VDQIRALGVDPKSTMSTSIHDHHILALTVNAAERVIRLRTISESHA
jgi:hypothetical protein